MEVKKISEFTSGTPAAADKILFEQGGDGKSAPLSDLPIPTKVQTALDGKASYSHIHSASDITSGTLEVARGGTGNTSLNAAANALINSLTNGESTPNDADYYVSQYVGGGTSTTTYHRRPMSALWNYIKGKADSTYLAKATYYTKDEIDSKLSNICKSSTVLLNSTFTSGTKTISNIKGYRLIGIYVFSSAGQYLSGALCASPIDLRNRCNSSSTRLVLSTDALYYALYFPSDTSVTCYGYYVGTSQTPTVIITGIN